MKKIYKSTTRSIRNSAGVVAACLGLFLGLSTTNMHAQCIRTSDWGTLTVSDQTTTATNINTCIYTDEYSVITVNDPGQYEFAIVGTPTYLTFTDASNAVIAHGASPLTVSVPANGVYRVHYAENAACGSVALCRTSTAQYIGPLAQALTAVVGTGTLTGGTTQNGSPIYRSSTTSGFDYAMSVQLMTQADLAAAGVFPGVDITQIAYFKTTVHTMADRDATYRVYVKNSNENALVSGSPFSTYIAGSTLVYENLAMDDTDIPNTVGWMPLPFSAPFTYTGGSIEVALEWSVNPGATNNRSTGAFQWEYGVVTNAQAIGWSSSAAPTPTTNLTTSTNFLYNCEVSFLPAAGTDLGISEFVNPVAACPGSTPVTVAIINSGGEAITSATIGWTLNGITQTPISWTGNLAVAGDTAHVNLGSFTSVAGTNYSIEAFLSAVGPGTDSTTLNDSLAMAFTPALSGTYTVNAAAPVSATNFQSLVDVANTLNSAGICGPVIFNVAPNSGPYIGRVELLEIMGSSATNTITINGNGNWLTNEATATDLRAALMLDGTDYLTIDSLNIEATGTWAWGVQLMNEADHNTIKNCKIEVPMTSTSTFFANVVMSGSTTGGTTAGASGSFNTFENNHHIGGYYSFTMMGENAANRSQGNKILNSVLEDMALYGIYCSQQAGTEIIGNVLNQSTRTNGSTFYGVFFTASEPSEVSGNHIYDIAANYSATISAYPLYFTGSGGASAASPLKIHNNAIYNLYNNGLQYGIYLLGVTNNVELYHNTVALENLNQTGASTLACLYHTGVATNVDVRNNIFHINNSNTGTQYNIWFSNANPGFSSNNNAFYNSNPNGIVARRGTVNSNTLADWQASNGNIYDQNSVFANPVFANLSSGLIAPLSSVIDNIGTPLGITSDINGAPRSTTTPDPGAVEFAGIAADIALIDWEILRGGCLSNSDTLALTIRNVIGPTVNLATNNVVANWQVTGPVTSNGTITFNSGTLSPDATLTGFGLGVDMSVAGVYTINAWLDTSSVNLVGINDTINGGQFEVRPIISVTPQTVTVGNPNDTIEISVNSPFMPGGGVFITEICHFRGSATGAMVGGWPAYLLADDYIELTGVPNSDISGYTIEMWSATALTNASTLDPGTILSPQGTAVIATGQLGSSVPSPANYYYHSGYTGTMGSTTAQGYVIKDPGGNIVDAVMYGGITFPPAANVSPADWTGITPSVGSAGNRLEGAYTKDATNWINSGVSPQDPNLVNNLVTVPVPGNLTGLEWSHQGVVLDTVAAIYVGPWSVPGTYYYTATYQSPCGPLTDSVEVIVDFPYCFEIDSLMVDAACVEAEVSWISGPWSNSSTIEYGVAGFTPGTGTTVFGASSPYMLTGLSSSTTYDVYVTDTCAGFLSTALGHDSTLSSEISSEYNFAPTTSTISACAGSLSVNIPAGANIDSIAVEYDFTAGGGAWMSEQLSYLVCTSPGGTAEASVTPGPGVSSAGTATYTRSGLTIANGVAGGGAINFQLHAFRSWGGAGCDNIYNVVDANSFKVTVYTTDSVFTQIGESAPAMTNFTTQELPVAVGFSYVHNGSGGYDFVADTGSVGNLSWNFGDGNSAMGDSVTNQYASEGTYSVLLIATNDCGSDTAMVQLVYTSVEHFGLNTIALYPNPSTGVFSLSQLPIDGGKLTLVLNDMQGRGVMTKVYEEGLNKIELNIEHLRAGTYYLTISNGVGQVVKPVILVK
ncbi:MAG: T9SS type A sorting domain-containing protein [Cryomorphaceae bacterium]|nr:T9SS type A sorting domain-containing protein [Cryomorphaceae bacterium]